MDLAPLEEAAVTAAASIISACGIVAVAYIRSHINNIEARAVITRAITLGAGIAHDSLTTAVANGTPNWTAAKATAIAEGTAAAQQIAASVTTESVTAALAPLFAVDPSVPAGPSPSATATGQPGDTAAAIAGPALTSTK